MTIVGVLELDCAALPRGGRDRRDEGLVLLEREPLAAAIGRGVEGAAVPGAGAHVAREPVVAGRKLPAQQRFRLADLLEALLEELLPVLGGDLDVGDRALDVDSAGRGDGALDDECAGGVAGRFVR